MKSIEEIKEEVARSSGFPNWKNVEFHNEELGLFDEVIIRHSQQYIDANKKLVEMLEFIFYKTNFQNHFPTTSIKVKNLLSKHTTHDKGKEVDNG